MKAIRIHEYGGPNVLQYEDAPIPDIGPDGVLIRARAAGVNPVDWKIRKGLMTAVRPLQFPAVVGADVSGTVERVGSLVSRFKPGDAVVARVDGAYAEFAAVKTDAVAPAPKSIPLEHAAALPIAAGTAWTLLFDAARVRARPTRVDPRRRWRRRFIRRSVRQTRGSACHRYLFGGERCPRQIARSRRSYRLSKVEFRDRGEKRRSSLGQCRRRDFSKNSYGVVRKAGLLLAIASPPDEALANRHGITARFERGVINGVRLQEIGGLIDVGKVRVIVEKELPLEEAAFAHELSEAGHVRGKIILNVG